MREYCWYSPEYNWIIFQWICEGCDIAFEWDYLDIYEVAMLWGTDCDPTQETTWIPLGEV